MSCAKWRGVLFDARMVEAILGGKKTETRRVIKPEPPDGTSHLSVGEDGDRALCIRASGSGEWLAGINPWRRCPYGVPGDMLWVRETHWIMEGDHDPWPDMPSRLSPTSPMRCYYRAGFDRVSPRWRPSIHMPRWASRISLHVESMGAELVRDITEAEAMREGALSRDEFAAMWNQVAACRGYKWEDNPWVWVVRFSVHEEV